MTSYQGIFSKDTINYADEILKTDPAKIKVQHFSRN